MKNALLGLLLLYPLSAVWAQLQPANEAGVTLGHFHTTVRDVDASEKFLTTLGGKAITIDQTRVMKFPGVFGFLTKGAPTGGTYGSVVNHVGFLVQNDEETIAQWKGAGINAEYLPSA